ncbi:MAG: hypothetical protein WC455_25210 [Dehalococcoidia bacterium]|jgi:hypothetical protein
MPNLLESTLAFFDQSKNQTEEQQAANAIALLNGVQDAAALVTVWAALPEPVKLIGIVTAAKSVTQARVDLQEGRGPFASVPKALFEGFADLIEPMESMAAEMLRRDLQPGSPESKHAFDEILDTMLDTFLTCFRLEGKSVPRDVAEAFKTSITPLLSLGLTLEVATTLAEHIHPSKEVGWKYVSHFLHDTVGFKALTESYVWPIRKAMIEHPTEKSMNRLFQPYLPTQGELTGLARKYEITEDQYRDAMRGYGVREEYINALLTGFWADPRLREILLLAQVERPDAEAPDAARQWLTRAGLSQYIGPDWWFALKFAKAGYDRIDIPVLIKVVRSQFLIKELGDLRTMRRAQYKSGQLSRAGYEEFLRGRGLREEELAPQLDAIEAERVKDQNDETQKLYELQYKNGRITADALKSALIGLGLAEERVTSRVEYLTTQKLGKLREDIDSRVPTRSDLEQTYKRGAMTKEALIKRLDDMGYTMPDAQLIADNAENDLIVDVAQEWQRAYEYRTRYGRMTAAELKTAIAGLGKSDAYAEARAAYIAEVTAGKTGEVGEVSE